MKIRNVGVCSSDIQRGYDNGAYFYPLIMGHEMAGEIVEVVVVLVVVAEVVVVVVVALVVVAEVVVVVVVVVEVGTSGATGYPT